MTASQVPCRLKCTRPPLRQRFPESKLFRAPLWSTTFPSRPGPFLHPIMAHGSSRHIRIPSPPKATVDGTGKPEPSSILGLENHIRSTNTLDRACTMIGSQAIVSSLCVRPKWIYWRLGLLLSGKNARVCTSTRLHRIVAGSVFVAGENFCLYFVILCPRGMPD